MPDTKKAKEDTPRATAANDKREPRLLTEKEVSALTGLSVCTLRKWRFERRHLPYIKIGSSVRYADTDILALRQTNRIDPRS